MDIDGLVEVNNVCITDIDGLYDDVWDGLAVIDGVNVGNNEYLVAFGWSWNDTEDGFIDIDGIWDDFNVGTNDIVGLNNGIGDGS